MLRRLVASARATPARASATRVSAATFWPWAFLNSARATDMIVGSRYGRNRRPFGKRPLGKEMWSPLYRFLFMAPPPSRA